MMRQRQQKIVGHVEKVGIASLAELAQLFDVSEFTIRRDIDYLAKSHLVAKVKGGAQRIETPSQFREAHLPGRMQINLGQKERIAARAIEFIRPGDTVFLDGSSTIACLARAVARSCHDITVVTNSILVALELSEATEIRLVGCILIFPLRVYVAAFWLIPFWFLINFLGATLSPEQGSATGYWAHLGGFFAGLPFGILSRIWVAREQRAEKEPPPAIDSPAAMLARYREGIHSFIIAGDFDSAWTAWQNMQADFPKALLSIEDQFALARLAEKREIYDAAALAYRILANSNHADEIRARAAVHMGGLYLDRLGDKDRAALIFQKVISKFPRTDAVRDAEQRLEEIFGRSGLAGT